MIAPTAELAPHSQKDPLIQHIFSLKRSGHHAVMQWLRGCYEAAGMTSAHVNDVYEGHIGGPRTLSREQVLAEASENTAAQADVVIVNYEDLPYRDRHNAPAYALDTSARDVIVVRDFANLAASRFAKIAGARATGELTRIDAVPWDEVITTWKESAAYLDQITESEGPVAISYNSWSKDLPYRQATARRFGLDNADTYKNTVSRFGGGSSFNGLIHDGQAEVMNVHERWVALGENFPDLVAPYVEVITSDPEVARLNEALFGISFDQVAEDLGRVGLQAP